MATRTRIDDVESCMGQPPVQASGQAHAEMAADQQPCGDITTTAFKPEYDVAGHIIPESPCHARLINLSLFVKASSSALKRLFRRQTHPIISSLWKQPEILVSQQVFREATQGMFVCFTKHGSASHAISVKCLRPSTPRIHLGRTVRKDGSVTRRYGLAASSEQAVECDSDIYERISHACYSDQGLWKKLIPFFGVVSTEEVTLNFKGGREAHGRYQIRMTTLDIGEIKRDVAKKIDNFQNIARIGRYRDDFRDNFCDGQAHSEDFSTLQEACGDLCALIQLESAEWRSRRLRRLEDLPTCILEPQKANSLDTLKGLAQESLIYTLHGSGAVNWPGNCPDIHTWGQLRGLHVAFGWQWDRMKRELLIYMSSTAIAVALIWLCTLLWAARTGDNETAFAFGALICGCATLLFRSLN